MIMFFINIITLNNKFQSKKSDVSDALPGDERERVDDIFLNRRWSSSNLFWCED